VQIDRYTMPKQPESTPVHVLSGRLASFRALESANVPAHAAAAGLPARTLMGPLSARQIEQFKQDGALLLPGFVGEAQLESYRDQAWAAIGYDRNDRSQCDLHGNISRDLQPPPHELPQFRALIDQLGTAPSACIETVLASRVSCAASFPGRSSRTSGSCRVERTSMATTRR
jgi:hypothetical protein